MCRSNRRLDVIAKHHSAFELPLYSKKRPEGPDAIGNVLRLEGHIAFRREEGAFVQLSDPIEAVMYGDRDLGILFTNSLKALLLGTTPCLFPYTEMNRRLHINASSHPLHRGHRVLLENCYIT